MVAIDVTLIAKEAGLATCTCLTRESDPTLAAPIPETTAIVRTRALLTSILTVLTHKTGSTLLTLLPAEPRITDAGPIVRARSSTIAICRRITNDVALLSYQTVGTLTAKHAFKREEAFVVALG